MSYSSVVLADNPIRYYRLGESSGTVAIDIGSQAQNGTLNGGITLAQTGLLVGDSNTSMLFNGSTGYISCPTTGLPSGGAVWSVECWIQLQSLPSAYQVFWEFGNNGTTAQEAYLSTNPSNQIEFVLSNANRVTSSVLLINTPYHIVGVFDGVNFLLYLNGVLQGSVADFAAIVLSTFNLGTWGNLSFYYAGFIDEVAFYPYVLAQGQVTAHYTAGITPGYVPHKTRYTGRGIQSTIVTQAALRYVGRGLTSTLVTHYIGRGLSGTLITPITRAALSSSLTGVGTLTETFSLATPLSVTLAGVGTITAPLLASLDLGSVTIPGVGMITGTASLRTALTTTIPGIGTLTETFTLATSLTDTIPGIGTLTGTSTLTTALASTFAGVGTLTGSLGTSAPVALSATLAGVGTLVGTTSLATVLSVTLAGIGTLTGTMGASGSVSLSATLAGAGTLAGVFTIRIALFLTCAGAGTLTGTITIPVTVFLSATCVTRDMQATAITRDMQTVAQTRDERIIAQTRDEKVTATTRDMQATAKTRG